MDSCTVTVGAKYIYPRSLFMYWYQLVLLDWHVIGFYNKWIFLFLFLGGLLFCVQQSGNYITAHFPLIHTMMCTHHIAMCTHQMVMCTHQVAMCTCQTAVCTCQTVVCTCLTAAWTCQTVTWCTKQVPCDPEVKNAHPDIDRAQKLNLEFRPLQAKAAIQIKILINTKQWEQDRFNVALLAHNMYVYIISILTQVNFCEDDWNR